MDISPVSALPAATAGLPAGGSAPDQTTPAVTASAPVQTNAPAPAPSNANSTVAANPSLGQLAQAVNQVNDSFKEKGQDLYAAFEKDKATGINVVKIVDQKTHETVSQMPIKEMLAFAQSLEHPQGSRGKLINATA